MYAEVFHRFVYPTWESRLRGRPTFEHLATLERTQWWPAEELARFQGEALSRLIAHAYAQVPFYRARLDERGLRPEDFKTAADIARLPVLDREVAADAGEALVARSPGLEIRKMTGGTTGAPLRFGYDRGSEYWRQAVKLRGWGWGGYRVGERMFYYWGPATHQTPPWKTRAKIALDRFARRETYVDCTNRGPDELDRAVEALRRARPRIIVGYAQALVDLARRAGPRFNDAAVLACAERLGPEDRATIRASFGPVFDTYGCREFMLIGAECEEHNGLHLSSENLIVEVLVREGDSVRPAEPGEQGEVVITDLHNYGMPLIRYANGDLAIAEAPAPCACGRGLPRLRSVAGRVADRLRDAQGRPVCGILFSRVFTYSEPLARAVRRWQAVQRATGEVTLRLELRAPLDEAAERDLSRSLEQYLPGVPVKVEEADRLIPGKNGKLRTVVVERAPAG